MSQIDLWLAGAALTPEQLVVWLDYFKAFPSGTVRNQILSKDNPYKLSDLSDYAFTCFEQNGWFEFTHVVTINLSRGGNRERRYVFMTEVQAIERTPGSGRPKPPKLAPNPQHLQPVLPLELLLANPGLWKRLEFVIVPWPDCGCERRL